jgi:hypothetical protein
VLGCGKCTATAGLTWTVLALALRADCVVRARSDGRCFGPFGRLSAPSVVSQISLGHDTG